MSVQRAGHLKALSHVSFNGPAWDVSFDQTRAAMSIRPCGEIGDTSWAYVVSSFKLGVDTA